MIRGRVASLIADIMSFDTSLVVAEAILHAHKFHDTSGFNRHVQLSSMHVERNT